MRSVLTSFIFAALLLSGASASAATYSLTSNALVTNWSDSTKWNNNSGSTYPGQSSGDVVTVGLSGFTLNIDVVLPNPVQLNVTGSNVAITIPAGGSLMLVSSSGVASSDSVTVAGGTFGVASGSSISSWTGPITLNSGSINLAGSLTMTGAAFKQASGSLSSIYNSSLTLGSGATGTFSGGSISGAIVYANSGSSLTIDTTSSPFTLDTATIIVNDGATATWQGSQQFAMNNGSNVGIVGTFNWTGAGNVTVSGAAGVIDVQGLLNKTTSSGTIGVATQLWNDFGTISSQAGSLQLNYTGTTFHQGTFDTSAGATIDLGGGGSTFGIVHATGSGKLRFLQGSHNVGSSPLINVEIDQATLTGSGLFSVTGTLDWKGGAINTSTFANGTVNLLGTLGTMTLGADFSLGSGAIANFSSTANPLSIGTGSAFYVNGGTFLASSDASIIGGGTFVNGWIFTKSGGSVTTISCTYSTYASTTNVNNGRLLLTGGGTDPVGSVYNVAAPATIEFGGGTRTFNGTLNATGNVIVSGGTLTGTSPLTLNGTANSWSGGTISGGAAFTVNSGATLNLSGSGAVLDGRTLTNNGTIHADERELERSGTRERCKAVQCGSDGSSKRRHDRGCRRHFCSRREHWNIQEIFGCGEYDHPSSLFDARDGPRSVGNDGVQRF